MTPLERLDHAADVHGLKHRACPDCDGSGLDCRACNGHGRIYWLDRKPCGRADCPIGRGQA